MSNYCSDESKLLRELSQGSERAFTELYNRYKNVVYSCAMKITKSKTLSDEVVQEIFLKIWCKKEALTDIAHFESYIFIMARNQVFNLLKKIARERNLKNEIHYNSISFDLADSALEEQQFKAIFNKIIKQLPPQQQKVYRMVREEDLNYQQIAELLEISPLTVQKHMAQATKLIRLKLIRHIHLS
jgi:RNA polymerase sigma-70 factor (family 1)